MSLDPNFAKDISLKIVNHKCFGTTPQGFDNIFPINVIVGRNNSGKSSLLELVEAICGIDENHKIPARWKNNKEKDHFQIFASHKLSEQEVRGAFLPNMQGGGISGNHWNFGKDWVGKEVFYGVGTEHVKHVTEVIPDFNLREHNQHFLQILSQSLQIPFRGLLIKRLEAERNIIPEAQGAGNENLKGKGRGATDLIRLFINDERHDRDLVEEVLLADLNKIFFPDADFSRIMIEQNGNNWEIFFEEKEKGRVRLSHYGSGLKTVLLVLCYIHLIPSMENKELSDYVFLFEELENNIHPALQRRLLSFIRNIALKHECYFFLTTHSNIAIDTFSKDENAQIVHVTHDQKHATVNTVVTYVENKNILDDLDIRASDLLQSNGVVWVEGPSDRLYFNRWVEIFSDSEIKEGLHYQCVFYGGRLLSHLDAKDPDIDESDLIKILRVNANAIILIDSDIKTKGKRINTTKRRIKKEVEDVGGVAWVTKGREIENYIPKEAIEKCFDKKVKTNVGLYDDFYEYLDKVDKGQGTKYCKKKPRFAELVVPYLTKADLQDTLDMESQVMKCIKQIRVWNRIS
jgi:predicted ATP-dependent endonuclease of OLD family